MIGDVHIARILIAAKAGVTAADSHGFTPLMRTHSLEFVKLFIANGAWLLIMYHYGQTAEEICRSNTACEEVIQLFLTDPVSFSRSLPPETPFDPQVLEQRAKQRTARRQRAARAARWREGFAGVANDSDSDERDSDMDDPPASALDSHSLSLSTSKFGRSRRAHNGYVASLDSSHQLCVGMCCVRTKMNGVCISYILSRCVKVLEKGFDAWVGKRTLQLVGHKAMDCTTRNQPNRR